jgi:2-polyprenyl-3-methyl-5-hydroxy-6-metoxy-1,4-benzoquinol methylase
MEGTIMETARDVQRCIDGLIDSTWAFSALASAVETGLIGALDPSCTAGEAAVRANLSEGIATALLDVLVALGLARRESGRYVSAPGLREFLRTSQQEDILAWLRSAHFQSRAMVEAARRGELRPGWNYTDPEILQAQGRTGRTGVQALAAYVFPTLSGLLGRLESPGGTFLDIGMGVGIICIEMCRIYPNLRCVGLEPGEAQADEAGRNIAAIGLQDRIEVRRQRLEDLTDVETYDLAYLPQVFMPIEVVKRGLRSVREALRPGGWILVVTVDAPGDDLHSAFARLLNVLWGGTPLAVEEVISLVREAGFEMVQAGGDPGSWIKGVVGRRPPGDQ